MCSGGRLYDQRRSDILPIKHIQWLSIPAGRPKVATPSPPDAGARLYFSTAAYLAEGKRALSDPTRLGPMELGPGVG